MEWSDVDGKNPQKKCCYYKPKRLSIRMTRKFVFIMKKPYELLSYGWRIGSYLLGYLSIMLSLYVHIPFCNHKCAYCSFFVLPEEDDSLKDWSIEKMKEKYLESLLNENKSRSHLFNNQSLKTIYIWWWTPFQLGPDRLFALIDELLETRDCEYLEELSIELNPDPFDEVIDFIRVAQNKYKNLFRLRFSIWIQTFDDAILKSSKRNYVYNNMIHWLREVIEIKGSTTSYNLDFIAFGNNPTMLDTSDLTLDGEKRLPRDSIRRNFFKKLVDSLAFDWFSLYTLELFPWAEWYYNVAEKTQKWAIFSDDETIWNEFQRLKDTLTGAGYNRYEISNFALSGKRSLHNMAYRNMWNYLGLGINSSSYLASPECDRLFPWNESSTWIRFKNTQQWKSYLSWDWIDEKSLLKLDTKDKAIEEVMLHLRTDVWFIVQEYHHILVDDVDTKIADFVQSWHMLYDELSWRCKLTWIWFDVYNTILLDLLKDI